MPNKCEYKGQTYSDGAKVCQEGEIHRCDDGTWTNLHFACDLTKDGVEIDESVPDCDGPSQDDQGIDGYITTPSSTYKLSDEKLNALAPCVVFYHNAGRLYLHNRCAECMTGIIVWQNDPWSPRHYDVPGHESIEITRITFQGDIVDEKPC